jgi:uncharacterized damage-inducible protein DinB
MPNPVPDFETDVAQAFVAQARNFLANDYLPKIERCLDELTDENVWWRANENSNSVGNLLLHLCGNARQWIVCGLGGSRDERQRQLEFDERSHIPRTQLLTQLKATLKDVDKVFETLDPGSLLTRHQIQASDVIALEAIFHVVEHFSMHTGQIITLTKLLTESDLRFYDFSTGVPVHTWLAARSGAK